MLASIAKDLELSLYFKYHEPKRDGGVTDLFTVSIYAAISRDPKHLAPLVEENGWAPYSGKKHVQAWTDDYANILSSVITKETW